MKSVSKLLYVQSDINDGSGGGTTFLHKIDIDRSEIFFSAELQCMDVTCIHMHIFGKLTKLISTKPPKESILYPELDLQI
jgi:hypothetical protein